MKQFMTKAAGRLAPRTVSNLRTLSALDEQFQQGPARFVDYERELRTLRREIDELRRDNRRVAELYDAVFDWVKSNAAEGAPTTPAAGVEAQVRRIAGELVADE